MDERKPSRLGEAERAKTDVHGAAPLTRGMRDQAAEIGARVVGIVGGVQFDDVSIVAIASIAPWSRFVKQLRQISVYLGF